MGAPLPSRLENDVGVHVSVPRPLVAPRGRYIVGHVSSFSDSVVWHGARLSPPPRAWVELGRTLNLADLVAVGDYLIHHELPFCSAESLAHAVAEWGRRAGCGTLRTALPLLSDRAESRRESLLRVLLVTSGFTGLHTNFWITTSTGARYRGDLVFPAEKVVVEYQSRFHDNSRSFTDDMTRKSRLETDEWYVFEVNNADLDDPAELLMRLHTVLARRAVKSL